MNLPLPFVTLKCMTKISSNRQFIENRYERLGDEQWLGCHYRENWDLVEVFKDKSKYNVVLETERIDCLLFNPYTEGMSFEAAEKIQEMTLLQSIRDNEQSNKTGSVGKSVSETKESSRQIEGKVGGKIE